MTCVFEYNDIGMQNTTLSLNRRPQLWITLVHHNICSIVNNVCYCCLCVLREPDKVPVKTPSSHAETLLMWDSFLLSCINLLSVYLNLQYLIASAFSNIKPCSVTLLKEQWIFSPVIKWHLVIHFIMRCFYGKHDWGKSWGFFHSKAFFW